VSDGGGPAWQLLRDDKPVPASEIKAVKAADGLQSLSVVSPVPGVYSLAAGGSGNGRAHVFAVTQADAFREHGISGPPKDDAMLLLIAAGVVAGLGVVTTVALGVVGRRRKDQLPVVGADGLQGADATANGQDTAGEAESERGGG
jgi:hypothetical protein